MCRAREVGSVRRRALIIVTVLLFSSALATGIVSASTHPPRPAYGPQALWGSISPPAGWGFTQAGITNPGPQITVPTGDNVILALSSADLLGHTFWVDYNGDNGTAGEPQSPLFNSFTPLSWNFTATTTPGKYWYKCGFHGYFMEGRFIVQGASNLPPTVALTNPTGTGGDWTGGSLHLLTWTMSDPDNPTTSLTTWLNFSYNGGANRGTIAGPLSGLTSPASFGWTVPPIDATDVRVTAEVSDPSGGRGSDSKLIPTIDSTPPIVNAVIPANGATNVLVTSPVIVDFSEAMNPVLTNPSISFSPGVAGLTSVWSNGDMTWTVGHDDFQFLTAYVATITPQAVDASDPGNPLGGGNPFSWAFTTEVGPPHIVSVSPNGGPVPVNEPIVIGFDQAIDWSGHPFTYTISPDPGGHVETWTNANQTVTITHSDFMECTSYSVEVTNAQNAQGRNLVSGPAPNPWSFVTVCSSPVILNTNPPDAVSGVGTMSPIWVNFSKSMDAASVFAASTPSIAFAYTWSNANQTLTLSHGTAFSECAMYMVTVSGRDSYGNSLVAGPVPNPWRFLTACPALDIDSTDPPDGATNVSTAFSITVVFSEPMDTASIRLTISPPTVGPRTLTWSVGDTRVDVAFVQAQAECTTYSVLVEGNGTNGRPLIPGPVPNPWSFTTTCPSPPQVTSTTPVDGATGVPRSTVVAIAFSKAMSTASVTVSFSPSVGPTPCSWNTPTDTVCTIPVVLAASTWYFVNVTGADASGNSLVPGAVPYAPFHFKSNDPPVAAVTNPNTSGQCVSGGTVLAITWTMSDMETPTTSLQTYLNYSSGPNVFPIVGPLTNQVSPASYGWPTPSSQGDFDAQILMDVLDGAGERSTAIAPMVHIDATAPTVAITSPLNNAQNVPTDVVVQITFSEAMNTVVTGSTSVISFNPAVSGLTYTWSNGNRTVTVGHALLAASTSYQLIITSSARDACSPGKTLAADVVVGFTTGSGIRRPSPPTNLQVTSVTETTISLTWNAPTTWTDGTTLLAYDIQSYRVYRAPSATGTKQVAGSVTSTAFTDPGLLSDTTYYYWVTATATAIESDYSTGTSGRTAKLPDTTPPMIVHTPPASIRVGESVVIAAKVTDPDDAVALVKLDYLDAVGVHHNDTMALVSGDYTFSLSPQGTAGTIRYRIYAEDTAGNRNVTGEFAIAVQPVTTTSPTDYTFFFIAPGLAAAMVLAFLVFRRRRKKKGESGDDERPESGS